MIKTITTLMAVALASGCAAQVDEREMNFLASALTKVSASVDATVRYNDLPSGITPSEVLEMSVSHDPSLLKPFEKKRVLVLIDGKDSSVLVCDAQTGKALLEDTGCTARMDSHRWTSVASNQCEFTLNVKALCAQ